MVRSFILSKKLFFINNWIPKGQCPFGRVQRQRLLWGAVVKLCIARSEPCKRGRSLSFSISKKFG